MRRIHSTQPSRTIGTKDTHNMTEKHLFVPVSPSVELELTRSDTKFSAGWQCGFFLVHQSNFWCPLVVARKGAYSGLSQSARIRIASPDPYFCRVFTAELLRVLSNPISSAGVSAWKRRRTTAFSPVSFTLLYVEGGHSRRIRGRDIISFPLRSSPASSRADS